MSKNQVYFDESAREVYSEVYGGGGTIVVTELPEVGDEHTIYELQETSKASYGWVFSSRLRFNGSLTRNYFYLVFDTYEQMTSTINAIKIGEHTKNIEYFAYLRNENKLYCFQVERPVDVNPYWSFEEKPKAEEFSGTDYAFQVSNNQVFYILKEFVGNEKDSPSVGYEYSFLTVDNKEVYINANDTLGFVLKDIISPNYVPTDGFLTTEADIISNKLLNSVELETNHYNSLRATYGRVTCYNTSNNKYYMLNDSPNYYWHINYDDRDGGYFAQPEEEPTDTPPHYVGELDWQELPIFDTVPKFNDIPYSDIINYPDGDSIMSWVFQPKKDGEITSTYWVYSNNEWINIDDIKNPTDYIAIPFNSFGNNTTPIPLNKIHIYLDGSDTQLDIIPLDSSVENYNGLIYIQRDEEITTKPHTFKIILDNDVTFGDLGASVNLTGFWSLNTSSDEVNQETFTATVSGEVGKLELSNASDNPK